MKSEPLADTRAGESNSVDQSRADVRYSVLAFEWLKLPERTSWILKQPLCRAIRRCSVINWGWRNETWKCTIVCPETSSPFADDIDAYEFGLAWAGTEPPKYANDLGYDTAEQQVYPSLQWAIRATLIRNSTVISSLEAHFQLDNRTQPHQVDFEDWIDRLWDILASAKQQRPSPGPIERAVIEDHLKTLVLAATAATPSERVTHEPTH